MAATETILVVDDEPTVRGVVGDYLRREGFAVYEVGDGAEAQRWLATNSAALVVLDVMLPGVDGVTLLRQLRAGGDDTPVILLTARDAEADRVGGLEVGADDYVTKPFSARELVARVRSVLRRRASAAPSPGDVVDLPPLRLDLRAREATFGGDPVPLTPKEFDLLALLARHPRQAFTRRQLLDAVWASSPDWQHSATVTVHIGRLRSKVEPDPENPRYLVTVRGTGYRYDP
jgi:DNA-binding response OmpR family regulator